MSDTNVGLAYGKAHPLHLAGLWFAAIAVPAAWSTHFIAEYTLPKFLLLNAGVALAAAGVARSAPAAVAGPLDLPILLNLAALLLSTAASQDARISLEGRYNSYSHGVWTCGLYAALAWAAAWLPRPSARRTAGVLLAGGALVGLYGAAQVAGYEPFLRGGLPEGRAVSALGSPVDLGAFLAMLLPLAAAWAFSENAPAGLLAAGAIGAGLWATSSRGAWLGAAFGLLAFAVLAKPVEAGARLRRRPAAALGLAALLAVGGWFAYRRVVSRTIHSSDTARVEVWRSAWRVFRTRPVLGTGPDTFEQAFRRYRTEEFVRRIEATTRFQAYAHNDLLQSLASTGLVGAAAYLYLVFGVGAAAWLALRRPEDRWLAAGLAGGLAATFVNVKFNPVALEVMAQAAVFAGLAAALAGGATSAPVGDGPRAFRWAAAAAALLAAAGTLRASRWSVADLDAKYAQLEFARGHLGAPMDHLRIAAHYNPCETSYRVQFLNHVGELINADKTPAARLALLDEALAAGREAVRCHPTEVNAHYALGVAAWMHVQLGLGQHLELAERELDRALELDPMFLPLLETRLVVARRRGGPDAARIEQRIAAIKRLGVEG